MLIRKDNEIEIWTDTVPKGTGKECLIIALLGAIFFLFFLLIMNVDFSIIETYYLLIMLLSPCILIFICGCIFITKENNKKLFIKKRDALDLSYFEDNFIDVIITDPPWNIYNKQDINFEKFYEKMLTSFKRILKDSGSIIILMGNIDEFEKALSLVPELILFNKIDTLVNGKKASIYVIKKHI